MNVCAKHTFCAFFLESEPTAITRFSKGLNVPTGFRTVGASPQERDWRAESLRGGARGTLERTQGMLEFSSRSPKSLGLSFLGAGRGRCNRPDPGIPPGRTQGCTLRGAEAERRGAHRGRLRALRPVSAHPRIQLCSPAVLPPMPRSRLLPSLVAAARAEPFHVLVSVAPAPLSCSSPDLRPRLPAPLHPRVSWHSV